MLESLANELLLDLFEFLEGVHLLRAFRGLNARFDALLCAHFRDHSLDFRSISKFDFDVICQYLPLIVNRIGALCLSDDDETPGQIDLFLSRFSTLRPFINLGSLTLYDLQSETTMNKILIECRLYLPYLKHLKLNYRPPYTTTSRCLLDSIWRLPKLTHFYLRLTDYLIHSFIYQQCSLYHSHMCQFKMSALICMTWLLCLKKTPRLQYLYAHITDGYSKRYFPVTVPSITTLKCSLQSSHLVLMNLLQTMPNLRYLIVICRNMKITGHQWKEIIVGHLHKLKVFRFIMQFECSYESRKEQEVDALIQAFQSDFWLNERQWFVQCHWQSDPYDRNIFLYSLPYEFDDFLYDFDMSKFTCSQDIAYRSFDRVQRLHFHPSAYGMWSFPDIYFPNIRYLTLGLPFTIDYWSLFPKLDHLISLDVIIKSTDDHVQSQLQMLLDRAPRLHSLGLHENSLFRVDLAKLISSSVRRLGIYDYDRWSQKDKCITWLHSPLGSQCEILRTNVRHISSVFDILNRMSNLRALNASCGDLVFMADIARAELFEDLKDRLQSTCVITREKEFCTVRLWMQHYK